jgi:hypothetical protein
VYRLTVHEENGAFEELYTAPAGPLSGEHSHQPARAKVPPQTQEEPVRSCGTVTPRIVSR